MKLTVVILAAGIGKRYGGMKQLEDVGPSGETIMDYSIFDALRAGFGKVVFVIRPDMGAVFKESLGRRYEQRIAVDYALQRLDALPPAFSPPAERTKPWGTGQAVLAAAHLVHGPFAVINADDFYGAGSFAALGRFLQENDTSEVPTYAMVGYTLRDTLTEAGSVNRGCCRCSADGRLERIDEIIGLEPHGRDACYTDESGARRILSGGQLVSMNMWGFQPALFDQLHERFEHFLRKSATSLGAEFHLPVAVQELMHAGRARVKVLPTPDRWVGMTHPEDKPRVVAAIRALVERGVYPRKLWG